MLEYLFFNQRFCDDFTAFLTTKNIRFEIELEAVQNSLSVKVPDFTDDGFKPTATQTVGKGSNLYDLAAFNGREYRFGIRGKF